MCPSWHMVSQSWLLGPVVLAAACPSDVWFTKEKPGSVLTHHIIIKYGHFMTFWLTIKFPPKMCHRAPHVQTPLPPESFYITMIMDKLHHEIIVYI